MKRSRFTREQIIGVLKEHQAGATAPDLCRKHGISEATFYAWRSKYGGMVTFACFAPITAMSLSRIVPERGRLLTWPAAERARYIASGFQ